jgi:hypothetical protein
MKYTILTLIGLLFVSLVSAQKISGTKSILTKQLLDEGGLLIIQSRYSIGEASYSEQMLIFEKQDSTLTSEILVDTASFFLKFKEFDWHDTTLYIFSDYFGKLIDLEKVIFKNGIQPTYNCDGDNGRMIHNMTNIMYIYIPEKPSDIILLDFDSFLEYINSGLPKNSKVKAVNIGGGFLSLRDELINLGVDFDRCKTHWWDN